MVRSAVIQNIINKKKAKDYLEIGVFEGDCFRNITAKRKFAVDPAFKIAWELRKDTFWKKLKRKTVNSFENYCQVTSDDFFEKNKNLMFDVVFIDGLHTHQQSLKDTLHALDQLKDGGVIILHDCNPVTETQAYPAQSIDDARAAKLAGWTGAWSGDVWKTILQLRVTRDDLSVFVLNCDTGLGIIKKGKSKRLELQLFNDIEHLPYQFLEKYREEILNLKPVEYLEEFIQTL